MLINIITCCSEYFDSVLATSILGRAVAQGAVTVQVLQLREYADGKRKKIVDDEPYGGGPGQVLKIEPIVRALEQLESQGQRGQVWLLSAGGEVFSQKRAQALAKLETVTFICGHYEGVDERVKHFIDGELSLGQFVLTGGEPAVAAIIDAAVRLLPGVLGNAESLAEESFNDGLVEYPQYTRPADFRGLKVPEILLSGHHANISKWRNDQQVNPDKK